MRGGLESRSFGEILLENQQGILIHRDELVGWLKSLDKYGHEGDRAFYLESWAGDGSFTVDRIGRGTLHIPALCISIIGGIQPGPLSMYVHQASTGGDGDDGLLQRFQVLVWPDTSKTWTRVDRAPDERSKAIVLEMFRLLDAFEPFGPLGNEGFKTLELRFALDAQNLFNEWWEGLEKRLRNDDFSPALESHLGKYRSLMPSLALIFYLAKTLGIGQCPIAVDEESARQAIQWCGYLETHARRLYASGENPSMESARALHERIQKGDLPNEFSPRDVYYAKHWSKLDTVEKVNGAIKVLEEFGWVKTEQVKTPDRSTIKVIVHPQLRKKRCDEK